MSQKTNPKKKFKKNILENSGSLTEIIPCKKNKITPLPPEESTIKFSSTQNIMPPREGCGNIKNLAFIQQMPENQRENSYMQVLFNLPDCYFKYSTAIQTNPLIQAPNIPAMKGVAFRYYEKYQIEIYVQRIEDLSQFIGEYADTLTESCCIGIITGANLSTEGSHATPLLCYFNVTKSGVSVNVVILDSVLNGFYTGGIYQELENLKIDKIISIQGSARQADHGSCRTDALITLRNALLWIKHHKISSGDFSELFSSATSPKSNDPSCSDWIYHAQVYKKQDQDKKSIVLRRLYSNKTKKIETIEENRNRNKKPQKIAFEINNIYLSKHDVNLLNNLECPEFITKKQVNTHYTYFVFSLNVELNDYLVRKGIKWHQRYSKMQN